jgi:hypothetical protein
MQHMYDDLARALGIVAGLGCVLACFYMVYHSAMIAVCYYRDTSPDQRARTPLTYRPSTLPNTAKAHYRKAVLGMLAFSVFFLLFALASHLASELAPRSA